MADLKLHQLWAVLPIKVILAIFPRASAQQASRRAASHDTPHAYGGQFSIASLGGRESIGDARASPQCAGSAASQSVALPRGTYSTTTQAGLDPAIFSSEE